MCINITCSFCFVTVLLTGLPYIRLIPKVTAVSGETLHLKCPVAGYPIEEIHWERGMLLNIQIHFKKLPNAPSFLIRLLSCKYAGKYWNSFKPTNTTYSNWWNLTINKWHLCQLSRLCERESSRKTIQPWLALSYLLLYISVCACVPQGGNRYILFQMQDLWHFASTCRPGFFGQVQLKHWDTLYRRLFD